MQVRAFERYIPLTQISLLAFFLLEIGTQRRPRSDAADQCLHCLLLECSIKIWEKLTKIPKTLNGTEKGRGQLNSKMISYYHYKYSL